LAAKAIFKHATKAAKWYHIDVDATARQVGLGRFDIVNKLNEWNEEDVISLKTSGLQHVYKIETQLPATSSERQGIADTLFAQMHKRELQDLERYKDVMSLVTAQSCMSKGLAKHFGDDTMGADFECGHCSWCETHDIITVEPRQIAPEDPEAVGKLLDNVTERNDPRFLARIGFGIRSPRISALKYDKTAFFASLKGYEFPVSSSQPGVHK
jgi:hypothetical protein